jgi:hypothetical protein
MVLVIALLCALGFRVRGGLEIKGHKMPLNKYWFAVLFALCACYLHGWDLNYFIVVAIAARLSTQIVGWGKYVGACLSGQFDKTEVECYMIDKTLEPLYIKINGKQYNLVDKGFLYGVVALGLRGLILSFIIGLALQSIPFMLCGWCMGLVYYLVGLYSRKVKALTKGGWNLSEWVFGFYLGLILWFVI